MGEVVDIRQGIDIVRDPGVSPLFPEELNAFMQGFDREASLGKPETNSKYWEQRIEFARDRMRQAEVARKAVAVIASDAVAFMEQEPEKFAALPTEQQAVLGELVSRVIREE